MGSPVLRAQLGKPGSVAKRVNEVNAARQVPPEHSDNLAKTVTPDRLANAVNRGNAASQARLDSPDSPVRRANRANQVNVGSPVLRDKLGSVVKRVNEVNAASQVPPDHSDNLEKTVIPDQSANAVNRARRGMPVKQAGTPLNWTSCRAWTRPRATAGEPGRATPVV